MGGSALLTPPLVSDGADNFVLTANEIGSDVLRRIFEKSGARDRIQSPDTGALHGDVLTLLRE